MQDEHIPLIKVLQSPSHQASELNHLIEGQHENEINLDPPADNSTDFKNEGIDTTNTPNSTNVNSFGKLGVENGTESAEYIGEKMAELVALKAQFARVQNMINTTNLIEKHINEKVSHPAVLHSRSSTTPTSSETNNENVELLSTMANLFNDFSTDLRVEADNLRAERNRIRNLKEELIKARRQQ